MMNDAYFLISSRDPFETRGLDRDRAAAIELARAGNKVTVFLVQNGVLSARAGASSSGLGGLLEAGVEVLADDFSLRERGISAPQLVKGVTASKLDVAVDALAGGAKTMWL